MELESGAAVFEVVALADRVEGQFSRLARDRQSHAEAISHWRAHDEAARFDSEHRVDLAQKRRRQHVDHGGEGARIADKRSYVAKHDPGLGKIRDVADESFKFVQFHPIPSSRVSGRRIRYANP